MPTRVRMRTRDASRDGKGRVGMTMTGVAGGGGGLRPERGKAQRAKSAFDPRPLGVGLDAKWAACQGSVSCHRAFIRSKRRRATGPRCERRCRAQRMHHGARTRGSEKKTRRRSSSLKPRPPRQSSSLTRLPRPSASMISITELIEQSRQAHRARLRVCWRRTRRRREHARSRLGRQLSVRSNQSDES